MLLFPLYAFAVWAVCLRLRRRWSGALALAAGIVLILTVARLDLVVRRWLNTPSSPFTSLQFLLWGEVLLVTIVGGAILLMPRHRVETPCRRCGYDLHGLESDNPTCPECGLQCAARRPVRKKCSSCGRKQHFEAGATLCRDCVTAAASGTAAPRAAPAREGPGSAPDAGFAASAAE